MAETCKCELVILVDAAGDYAVGKDDAAAKEAYENEIQALSDADGFRLVRLVVNVPLPEAVELPEVDAPPLGDPTLTVHAA